MSGNPSDVLHISRKILGEYDLCDDCLGRLFVKKLHLQSNSRLGKKLHALLRKKTIKCYICKNLFDSLGHYVEKLDHISKEYEFETFLVGAKIKPSILDRDDQIRSQFQLRGIDSIKTAITRHLARQFSKKTGAAANPAEPDVVFTVDFKADSCTIQSKPLFLFGRYTKSVRGVPQKQKPCENCLGKGCVTCKQHGMTEFDSVEGMISKMLFERFGAVQTKITWVGGEDATSKVLGSGRPFFVKLINPKKRNIRMEKKIPADKITVLNLKKIPRLPAGPISFISYVTLLISSEQPLSDQTISKLDELQKSKITVYEDSGKRSEKSVRNVRYRAESDNLLALSMTAEGGLPMKHFVSGENVFPNISDLLGTKCRCETFDFEEISITNQHFLHHV